jgi:serine/threonine protein kinase
MFVHGGKSYVSVGGKEVLYTDSQCALENLACSHCDLWVLDLSKVSPAEPYGYWTLLSNEEGCSEDSSPGLRHHAAAISNGELFFNGGFLGRLGRTTGNMWQTHLGCVKGKQTSDFFDNSCEDCPFSSYAPDDGHYCCLPCSPGTTTQGQGESSPKSCNVCDRSRCRHGKCTVDTEVHCSCNLGYLEVDHCGQPWLLIIPLVLLFVVVVTIFAVRSIRKRQRYQRLRRMQLLQSRREIEEMSKGWEIQPDEVQLIHRIDEHSPGACGEVWLSEWQGMRVAFKRLNKALLELDEEGYTSEFDREVRFMRSIRHPNIVLFFGAGRLSDNTPFLVTEFMACGSLQEVLHDSEKSIDLSLKIRFTLDAAKGMRFLHFCQPPRIHRDLKTGNLLVNDRWVVKVADFGTSRLLESPGSALFTADDDGLDDFAQEAPAARPRGSGLLSTPPRRSGSVGSRSFLEAVASPFQKRKGLRESHRRGDGDADRPLLGAASDSEGSSAPTPSGSQRGQRTAPSTSVQQEEDGTLIADYGPRAHEANAALFLTRHVGTPVYMAPEIMGDRPYTTSADVYSFGIVLWEIYTRQVPFSSLVHASVFRLRREVQNGVRPPVPEACPAPLASLIRECWAPVPHDRPNFDSIVTRLTALSELSSLYGNTLEAQSGRGGDSSSQAGVKLQQVDVDAFVPPPSAASRPMAISVPQRRPDSNLPSSSPGLLVGEPASVHNFGRIGSLALHQARGDRTGDA